MRSTLELVAAALVGFVVSCAAQAAPVDELDSWEIGPVGVDSGETDAVFYAGRLDGPAGVPDVRCASNPETGGKRGFRHFTSSLIAKLGGAHHRGLDLIASADSAVQQLEGWASYAAIDKALEDEDVEAFACRGGKWFKIGTARTDDEGHFTLALTGAGRQPIGMRDLFLSIAGDRTGARFLGYVAPAGSQLVVSDVDGTLTSSENAFLETILLGLEPDARAGAATAFGAATAAGRQLIYVTARGNQYTQATRDWLAHRGFPRGPLRLSPSFITLPGGDTVEFKTSAIAAVQAAGFSVFAGVGNRASDITAYIETGVTPDRIFIELPDYADELQPLLDAELAVGFTRYDELVGKL
jgi:hypothetical protein